MSTVDPEQWSALWIGICELSEYFPEGVVFIGGVAVYLHARAGHVPENWIDFSHDGDLYISLADFGDLRDTEEVTANRRLTKHQFIKNGIDFDVYLEYNNGLRVPYADIRTHSVVIEQVRVASLEHLLVLKSAAYAARKGSAKGRKDERDLIRIAHLMAPPYRPQRKQLKPYVTPRDVELLEAVSRTSPEFVQMSKDHKQTKRLREDFDRLVRLVRDIEKKP
jgi:hypothetical protein